MTSKKSSRQAKAAITANSGSPSMPATMVPSSESAWSGARTLNQSRSAGLSRQRMLDARGDLLRSEREFIALTRESEESMLREAEAVQRKAAEVRAEAWAIEQELQTKTTVLKAQARMENELAKHIRDIAERSALSILDRIREASDSMMDWAGLIGDDLTALLKNEATAMAERKFSEIESLAEAMDEEQRAVELLELTARYKEDLAA